MSLSLSKRLVSTPLEVRHLLMPARVNDSLLLTGVVELRVTKNAVLVIVLIIGLFAFASSQFRNFVPESSPTTDEEKVELIASNLDIPWEIEFLPDNTFFITERRGIVWQFDKDGKNKRQVLQLTDISHIGEGGLLGIVNHPKHSTNGLTYLYYTYSSGKKNKVVRYKHISDSLVQDKVIIDNIPGNANHNGGRIKFGPDGKLYITTGDSENPSTSQDKNSLAGKILRLSDDGAIPADNPFGTAVFSYGHRNPQGLAWDQDGGLWSTEHGPQAYDEINRINPGVNYGWPDIKGDGQKVGMERPLIHSGSSTWAPSGAIIKDKTLYFTGLRGGAIFTLDITSPLPKNEPVAHFKNEFGRIRTINLGPDGYFYILTNNRDGRGIPASGDDRLIRIHPDMIK